MDDRSFFDHLASSWDDNEVLSTPEKVNEILDKIDLQPGEAVLDLGTGTGVLLPFIAERIGKEGKITAVDFSEGMLERAKAKFRELVPAPVFLNLDFENENIPGEYDHILLYCVYPHLHDPVNSLKWLRKVNLKPDGKIIIAFPCGPDFINNIHKERHSDSDLLPAPGKLVEFLTANGLDAEVVEDSDQSYIVAVN